jgi:hypothetical protein
VHHGRLGVPAPAARVTLLAPVAAPRAGAGNPHVGQLGHPRLHAGMLAVHGSYRPYRNGGAASPVSDDGVMDAGIVACEATDPAEYTPLISGIAAAAEAPA